MAHPLYEPKRYSSQVLKNEQVSGTCFLMTLARGEMSFRAGHEVLIHGREHSEDRTYSIVSGESDEAIQILYKVIPEGIISPRLAAMKPGDPIEFTGPIGSFLIRDFLAPMLFVATGTGIAPAISFVKSFPELNLTLVHGVRREEDLFGKGYFEGRPYYPCVTRQPETTYFQGRVTSFLPGLDIPNDTVAYLCGGNEMILAVRRQLKERGFPDSRVVTEAYYFW